MRTFALTFALGLSTLALGCGESASPDSGINEPIRVRNAQFIEGSISDEGGEIAVVDAGTQNSYVPRGYAGKKIQGHAEFGGDSVAIAMKGHSTGYWVLPLGAEDPNYVLERVASFEAILDFSTNLPPGDYDIEYFATDSKGRLGKPKVETYHVKTDTPPGSVVATLDWDSKADLDIHIIGPSGKELDPKHPNTTEIGEDGVPTVKAVGNGIDGNGELDRDSNGACVQDGLRRENVVWAEGTPPPEGNYLVQAHMWSACSTPAASFVFTLTVNGQELKKVPGRLLDIDADGGAKGPGLFVAYFTCDAKGNCQ